MDKSKNRGFTEKETVFAIKYLKRWSTSLVIKKIQIRKAMRYGFYINLSGKNKEVLHSK